MARVKTGHRKNKKDNPEKPESQKREQKDDTFYDELDTVKTDTNPEELALVPVFQDAPEIRPFKLGCIGPDFTLGFIGKRREGKSFAMRWVMHSMRDKFPRGYV